NVDVDLLRNIVSGNLHLDGVSDDVDGAAALDAGRLVGIEHSHWNAHADFCAFAEPQEVHMHRQVAHRIELEVARDHAVLGALHIELVDGGEEAPRIDAL